MKNILKTIKIFGMFLISTTATILVIDHAVRLSRDFKIEEKIQDPWWLSLSVVTGIIFIYAIFLIYLLSEIVNKK